MKFIPEWILQIKIISTEDAPKAINSFQLLSVLGT